MTFTAKDVMTLRQKTGLGMMDCKAALAENNGDPTAAEEWLRAKRKGKMEQRTERATGEGRIGIAIQGSNAVIVEVRTETDFTARNEDFVKMVEDVTASAMNQPAGDVSADDTIVKRIDDLRIVTGENVNFARGEKLEGGAYGKYLHHDGKRGVLIQVDGLAVVFRLVRRRHQLGPFRLKLRAIPGGKHIICWIAHLSMPADCASCGKSGYLCPPHCPQEAAAAIVRLRSGGYHGDGVFLGRAVFLAFGRQLRLHESGRRFGATYGDRRPA